MGAFTYEALDPQGRTQRGVLEAETARAARGELRDRGLVPLDVAELRERAPVAGRVRSRGLDAKRLALMSRQLATLVDAGLPLDEALSALTEQNDDARSREVALALRARVLEGRALAAAMAEHPASFTEAYRACVAAGEASGRLGAALSRLADDAESREALGRSVLVALAYPALLTVVALAVVSGLLVYVVPKVVDAFARFGGELPFVTRALLAIAAAVRDYGVFALIGLAAIVVAGGVALRGEGARRALDRALLRVPVLGRLLRTADTARAARVLSTLIGSGVNALDALVLAAQSVRSRSLRDALRTAAARVREGSGFARALGESGRFPPVAVRLVASGERSGRLDAMLEQTAQVQQRELETLLGTFTAVLGPLVILAVGALVLFIVVAILLPIFELNQLIR